MIKKIGFAVVLLVCICLPAWGATDPTGSDDAGIYFNPADFEETEGAANIEQVELGNRPPLTIAAQIINIALSLVGVFFLGLMIYAGFMWMTARGNEEQVKKAKDMIKGALIGLVIILASFGIAQFLFNYFSEASQVQEAVNP